jgi:uncharacterized membrane protein YphA (DoxX/SURF4 family)
VARKGFTIGFFGAAGLVLLRIAIGWHFLYAGIDKLTNPEFSSDGFLGQAKGPLADEFHHLIPDYDGRQRLALETHTVAFQQYADGFVKGRVLSDDQLARVKQTLDNAQDDLKEFFADQKEAIADYLNDLDRLEAAKQSKTSDIPFQQKRNWDKQQELRGKLARWSADIDDIWRHFKSDLDDVLTPEQRAATPSESAQTKHFVDLVVTYSNIAVGVCLLAGLFTRFAALGGALFLLQIVCAQPDWPGLYPLPHPSAGRALFVNKEAVEMMALFALAMLPTGRWCGLDFFVHHLIVRPIFGKKETA